MTPEQRAFEILYKEFGPPFSRDVFRIMIGDVKGGEYLRRLQTSIARGVVEDRAAMSAHGQPS